MGEAAGAAAIIAGTGSSSPRSHGGSATEFSVGLPEGASCPGDSADGGYRVQSFLVPDAVDPGALRYMSVGPDVEGGYALYDTFTNPYVHAQTTAADAPGQPGLIINIPTFNYAVFPPGELAPGRYHLGIACTLENATVRHWGTEVMLTASASDQPAGLAWRAEAAGADASGAGVNPLAVAGLAAVLLAALLVLGRRRLGRVAGRAATVGSVVLLAIGLRGAAIDGVPQASAAGARAGTARATVGATGQLTLALDTGSACPRDSADGGYRVQTYMTPATVDPAMLTFGSNGPLPAGTGAAFRQPLFTATGDPHVNQQTANADAAGGPGLVINLPAFDLKVFDGVAVPPGTYHVGVACTLGPAAPGQLERYWNADVVVAPGGGAGAAANSWTPVPVPGTSTGATGQQGDAAAAGPAAEPVAGEATGSSEPAASGAGSATALPRASPTVPDSIEPEPDGGGPPSATSVVQTVTELASVDASATSMVVVGLVLTALARIVVLVRRTPEVRTP